MDNIRLTQERLKSYLDGNQPARERLCVAVLAAIGDYTRVIPRRPRGGPDGGRDGEALHRTGLAACIAIGFVNSPSDSPADRAKIVSKFNDDARTARSALPDCGAFVFFTNVDLTPSDIDQCRISAKSQGFDLVDIFDRERTALFLCADEGTHIRSEHLHIHPEGRSLREQVSHLVRHFGYDVILSRPQAVAELGHYRSVLQLERPTHVGHPASLWLSMRDMYSDNMDRPTGLACFHGGRSVLSARPPIIKYDDENPIGTGWFAVRTKTDRLVARGHPGMSAPLNRYEDFDGCNLRFFASENLTTLIQRVDVMLGSHVVARATPEERHWVPAMSVHWSEAPLTAAESALGWREWPLIPERLGETRYWHIHFDSFQPFLYKEPPPETDPDAPATGGFRADWGGIPH